IRNYVARSAMLRLFFPVFVVVDIYFFFLFFLWISFFFFQFLIENNGKALITSERSVAGTSSLSTDIP
ncbi:MAG: hypothetical protein MUO63_03980, partial [Desulfobulbaceae bacterium]|nr:hypothetical protein [Desulfobulbaceae bacterium]